MSFISFEISLHDNCNSCFVMSRQTSDELIEGYDDDKWT